MICECKVNILKTPYSPRLKRIIIFITYKLGNNTTYSRKLNICRISPSVTTAKREFTPAIVSLRKLSTSREVDIIQYSPEGEVTNGGYFLLSNQSARKVLFTCWTILINNYSLKSR